MKVLKWISLFVAGAMLTTAYTKIIWQSGFDQGADVDGCVVASFQAAGPGETVAMAKSDPACIRAKAYESNPLWLLRRR